MFNKLQDFILLQHYFLLIRNADKLVVLIEEEVAPMIKQSIELLSSAIKVPHKSVLHT